MSPAPKPAQTCVQILPASSLSIDRGRAFSYQNCDKTLQVGVMSAVIPDPDHPEFSIFWVRDACFVYHPWLNELTVSGDMSLRAQMDDVVHTLTRTQQVISLA